MKPALLLSFGDVARWIIYDADGPALWSDKGITILWQRVYVRDEDTQERNWPADMRIEYERLLGRSEFTENLDLVQLSGPNLVEMTSDPDECAWDQKCSHGYRVEGHAVYCHNQRWLYAPTKCRRGEWLARVYGGDPASYAHEKCPGFVPNPLYTFVEL